MGVGDGGAKQTMSEGEPLLSAEALAGLRNLQRGVGEVALLMASHPVYGGMFLGDLRRTVMPPVLFNQYRIVRNAEDRTLGFVSWAKVSDGVHKRLMHGNLKLRYEDWQSGDHAVIMDVVGFSAESGERMLSEIKQGEFSDKVLWVVKADAGVGEPKLAEYRVLN